MQMEETLEDIVGETHTLLLLLRQAKPKPQPHAPGLLWCII